MFVVEITTTTTTTSSSAAAAAADTTTAAPVTTKKTLLWDRKRDGGFPETKELKRRVRDVIAPGRDLGHVDREYPKGGKGVVVSGGGGGDGKEGAGEVKEVGSGKQQGQQSSGVEGGEVDARAGKGKVCGLEGGRCEDCE